MADALATLAAMFNVGTDVKIQPIMINIRECPAHCSSVEEEVDGKSWYHDIVHYLKFQQYPEQSSENDKKTIRRLAMNFFLDGNILYNRNRDQVLLRCVDLAEAWRIVEEVHEGICGAHASGHMLARQVMRAGYYWLTLETDCIDFARKCHKCQIYTDKIHTHANSLNVLTSPWRFSMWGMDVIGLITPKIKHHNSMPYRPKMNGAVETTNKNIKRIIEKMTDVYKDWHEKLPFALHTYRTTVRTSTGATPFSLVYGMKAILPIEVEIPSLRVLKEVQLEEAEWVNTRYEQLNLIEEKKVDSTLPWAVISKENDDGIWQEGTSSLVLRGRVSIEKNSFEPARPSQEMDTELGMTICGEESFFKRSTNFGRDGRKGVFQPSEC
ncbi:Integrase zinc-binding domain - like 10 [Theobroma cacao]|nr:Integrase zinc-binding domain - like 10 [Theobroma cacao]